MKLLHNIGDFEHPNYNRLHDVISCKDDLSFDGIYRNVYDNRYHLVGKNVTLFVMGDYVGKDNEFDGVLPREELCSWEEIFELSKVLDAEIGWHSWSHRDLTKLTIEEIEEEVRPPFPMKKFAYPYGRFNSVVEDVVRNAGYEEAYSVYQGDGTRFQLNREYLK